MTKDGQGRTALVTGASAGIGKALAEVFAANGFDVILTARREDRLLALARELEAKYQIKAHVFSTDLADPAAPHTLISAIRAQGLRVDALLNNAGYGVPGNYARTPWSEQRDFLQVLVSAPAALAHLVFPGMLERGYGRIINVASVAGLVPGSAGHTLYGAAKSFMVRLSQSLHLEGETRGVFVSALCPGFTLSEFHDVSGTRSEVKRIPSYMWLTAEDVAERGYRAVMRGKVIEVPGVIYKGLVLLAKYLPDSWALGIVRRRAGSFRKRD